MFWTIWCTTRNIAYRYWTCQKILNWQLYTHTLSVMHLISICRPEQSCLGKFFNTQGEKAALFPADKASSLWENNWKVDLILISILLITVTDRVHHITSPRPGDHTGIWSTHLAPHTALAGAAPSVISRWHLAFNSLCLHSSRPMSYQTGIWHQEIVPNSRVRFWMEEMKVVVFAFSMGPFYADCGWRGRINGSP